MFTDWQMPGESGLDLISYIRERSDSPDPLLPVILLTANGDAEHVLRARKAGADDYLVKPFSLSRIIDRVTRVVTKQRPFIVSSVYKGPDWRRVSPPGNGESQSLRSAAARCHRAAAGWSVAGEGPWRAGGHSRRPATPRRGGRRRQALRQPNTRPIGPVAPRLAAPGQNTRTGDNAGQSRREGNHGHDNHRKDPGACQWIADGVPWRHGRGRGRNRLPYRPVVPAGRLAPRAEGCRPFDGW